MKNIIKLNVQDEDIYLKKGKYTKWRVVYPLKKDLDKPLTKDNFNWNNFFYGGLQNILFVLFILLLTFSFIYIYHHDTKEMQKIVNDPCSYCSYENNNYFLDNKIINNSVITKDE